MTRIAIVHPLKVEHLCQIVLSVPDYDIAWVSREGAETVKKCAGDRPDLLVIDPDVPGLDGLEAIRRIMQTTPCPILIITKAVEDNAARVFKAIGHGALDAVNTPLPGTDEPAQRSQKIFLKKMNTLIKLQGPAFPLGDHDALRPKAEAARGDSVTFRHKTDAFRVMFMEATPPLIAIGSSTGGPKTLVRLLAPLPKNLNAAIIIIQHLEEEFSSGLADWLNAQTPLRVRVAARGTHPEKGVVDVAGTNDHLVLTAGLTFAYTPDPRDNPYRPSVDVFFKSVAKHWPDKKGCAIVLTGMGRDGAIELANLRKMGWHTIAQDQATSVVYGMPKAAKELEAAVEILPIDAICPAILRVLKGKY